MLQMENCEEFLWSVHSTADNKVKILNFEFVRCSNENWSKWHFDWLNPPRICQISNFKFQLSFLESWRLRSVEMTKQISKESLLFQNKKKFLIKSWWTFLYLFLLKKVFAHSRIKSNYLIPYQYCTFLFQFILLEKYKA